jgi:hypothetical protein
MKKNSPTKERYMQSKLDYPLILTETTTTKKRKLRKYLKRNGGLKFAVLKTLKKLHLASIFIAVKYFKFCFIYIL